eukprot:TRINITY_DN4828_c0_g3_i1.p1 TRINITY_DN4828_c0_g3~~TRINITY_DN4828_c0_g3_i1.p1  ORF type:complete len:1132 (-),score=141.05 TRINITY_DN4828_c0_g3_i1:52-3366(-)
MPALWQSESVAASTRWTPAAKDDRPALAPPGRSSSWSGANGGSSSVGKKKMCSYFFEGLCTKGRDCSFAHSANELQDGKNEEIQTAWVAGTPTSSATPVQKTKQCTFFAEGKCSKGNQCTFAHGGTPESSNDSSRTQETPLLVSPRPVGGWPIPRNEAGGKAASSNGTSRPHETPALALPRPVGGWPIKRTEPAGAPSISEGSASKRKVCSFYQQGTCKRGSECMFAHLDNAAPPPRSRKENDDGDQAKVCTFYMRGECRKGWRCPLQHPVDDVGVGKASSDRGARSATNWDDERSKSDQDGRGVYKRKTKLCAYYARGDCKKGDDCEFIHAPDEQDGDGAGASVAKHTGRVCNFFAWGTCRRGESCPFVHSDDQNDGGLAKECDDGYEGSDSNSVLERPNRFKRMKAAVCSFFARGECKKGDQCSFSHPEAHVFDYQEDYDDGSHRGGGSSSRGRSANKASSSSRKAKQCSYFAQGHCKNGSECPFSHEIDEESLDELDRPALQRANFRGGLRGKGSTSSLTVVAERSVGGADGAFKYKPKVEPLNGDADCSDVTAKPPPWRSSSSIDKQPVIVPAVPALDRKTTLCMYYSRGYECRRGSDCTFLHELDPSADIRDTRESDGGGRKTRMCSYYAQGDCKKGSDCDFAHRPEELDQIVGHGYAEKLRYQEGEADRASQADTAKRKTKLCRHFKRGYCRDGEDCGFAHGPADLEKAHSLSDGVEHVRHPSHTSGLSALPADSGVQRIPKMCGFFAKGECKKGRECDFLHPTNDDWTPADGKHEHDQAWLGRSRPKTHRLCVFFENGSCKKGDDCEFSHGSKDMEQPPLERPPLERPLPRSKRVCTYFMRGECSKGRHCEFVHDGENEDEDGRADIPRSRNDASAGNARKHKTKICSFFVTGDCKKGSDCDFSHGDYEMDGQVKPNARSFDCVDTDETREPLKRRRKMCIFFESGKCKRGDACPFSHDVKDPADAESGEVRRFDPLTRRMCTHFLRGTCDRGSECRFAHGAQELQGHALPDMHDVGIDHVGNDNEAASGDDVNENDRLEKGSIAGARDADEGEESATGAKDADEGDWEVSYDEEGNAYYFHRPTGHTQWDPPDCLL